MNTAILIGFPLMASLLILFVKPEQAKKFAFALSIVELVLSFYALSKFKINAEPQMMVNLVWVQSLGIHFKVAMDGISILLVLLTTVLVPLIILSSFNREIKNPNSFYALILFMQMALVGVFTAMDGFLFYIFWELALIPIWFICLLWGGDNRARITFKFFVYTLAGSLLMLVALIYLYLHTGWMPGNPDWLGAHSFDIQSLYAAGKSLSSAEQTWIFWALFIAFAIKMPVF
ncbi:MAG: NuoM family protein, partial [Bacteroidia bacterium]